MMYFFIVRSVYLILVTISIFLLVDHDCILQGIDYLFSYYAMLNESVDQKWEY